MRKGYAVIGPTLRDGAIVYDNQISTTDDAGLTTVGTLLGGGSIQIHN